MIKKNLLFSFFLFIKKMYMVFSSESYIGICNHNPKFPYIPDGEIHVISHFSFWHLTSRVHITYTHAL